MDIQHNKLGSVSEIQVCPEYLAQHEGTDRVVMQMVDARGSPHRIYYLPKHLRPLDDGHITLPDLLYRISKQGDYKYRYRMSWRVHMARLIAEAALRFNRLGANRQRHTNDNIIFYPSPTAPGLEPFIEVQIEKGEEANANVGAEAGIGVNNAAHTRRRGKLLLNLGLVLLQLGLLEQFDGSPDFIGEEKCRLFILERCDDIRNGMSDVYADVVSSCANFFQDENSDMEEDEVEFRERYYHLIVHPLKQLDGTLQFASNGVCDGSAEKS